MKNETVQREWFDLSERKWNREENQKFAEIVTRDGIGFTFNLLEDFELIDLNRTSNDFRYFYDDEFPREKRPWKTGSTVNNGLTAKFFDTIDWVYRCKDNSFMVHSPYELPTRADYLTIFYTTSDLEILITPEIFQAEEDLRFVPIEDRKCYFDGERKLNHFKVYTQKNCLAECFSFISEQETLIEKTYL